MLGTPSSRQYYFGDPTCRPKVTLHPLRVKSAEHTLHQLELPYDPERVVMKVQCGETFSLFLDQQQHLLMLGWIKKSLGDTRRYTHKVTDLTQDGIQFRDVRSSANHVLALDRENTLYVWGSNAFGKLFLDKEKLFIPYR